jgi:hypothetical protein
MTITEEHLHHMAKRHHDTMRKFDAYKAKFAGLASKFVSTLEVSGGAFLGGVVEGKTDGGLLMKVVPINLAAGAALLVVGHLPWAEERGVDAHLNNVGNGLVAGYVASKGYAFGKHWHDTGKLFGDKGATALPAGPSAPVVHGEINEATMNAILARMQSAAAGAPGG